MKVKLTGIVRGMYSPLQQILPEEPAIMTFEGRNVEDVVTGLVLPEWIYTLHVNGKRIADPVRYLKRKGVWNLCTREAAV